MSFNGSGVFSPYTPGNPVISGATISSVAFNNTIQDLATGLSNAVTRDGQSPPTADLPMSSHKLTGLAAGTGAGDSVRFDQLPGASNLLPIGSGGTGASTAGAALAALGASPRATRIDVASVAGTVDLTANAPDTDDIRITGALLITGFTVAVGRVIRVTAGGAFSIANGASIVTNTGGNLTFTSGDTFMLRATAANVVEVLNYVSDASTTLKGRTRLATSAEAQALSNALTAISPATLAAAFQGSNQTLGATLNQVFPGGLIVKAGNATTDGAGQVGVTFATAFPNAVVAIIPASLQIGAGGYSFNIGNPATNGFGVYSIATATGNLVASRPFYWVAIGY